MNKIAHYLQQHLVGEVLSSGDVRRHFSTDASVFTLTPTVVAYPRNENDIRKVSRFTWQLAERGRVIPVTARGKGSDQSGAAIGNGIMLVFPAHMNRILEYDGKSGDVTVETGINYGRLQQTLYTHGRFLPPYPSSLDYSTIGGAIANNASGEKSVKYGTTRDYVRSMRVVLANGEVIETRRLSKRELNKKMGLSSFEGEIYRNLDKLIEENKELIKQININVSKNSAGYDIASVKHKGSFDLTPLIVGSQGTLGIVSEATLKTAPYNPHTSLIAGFFEDINSAKNSVIDLMKQSEKPSAIEMIDQNLLNFLDENYPNQLKGIVNKPFHKIVLLIEFDTHNERARKKSAKRAIKILNKYHAEYQLETEPDEREKLWKIRHSVATAISHNYDHKKALPIVEDGIVPIAKFSEYIDGVYKIFEKHKLKIALWGHAGDANLHMQPFLDLSQIGDRQKVFRIIDDYYNLVIDLGGSTSGEHGDGRLRAPYLPKLYGQQVYELFRKIKAIFDPYNTLNPGVKIDVSIEDIKPLLRDEYSLNHLFDHLPRS